MIVTQVGKLTKPSYSSLYDAPQMRLSFGFKRRCWISVGTSCEDRSRAETWFAKDSPMYREWIHSRIFLWEGCPLMRRRSRVRWMALEVKSLSNIGLWRSERPCLKKYWLLTFWGVSWWYLSDESRRMVTLAPSTIQFGKNLFFFGSSSGRMYGSSSRIEDSLNWWSELSWWSLRV